MEKDKMSAVEVMDENALKCVNSGLSNGDMIDYCENGNGHNGVFNPNYDGSNGSNINYDDGAVSNTGECYSGNDDPIVYKRHNNDDANNHDVVVIAEAIIQKQEVYEYMCACQSCTHMLNRIKTATNPALLWCEKKCSDYEQIRIIVCKVVGLNITIADFCSDIYTAKQHYDNGDYVWCGATVLFVALPVIITDILSIDWIKVWDREIKEGKRRKSTAPLWVRILLSQPGYIRSKLMLAFAAPILPIYIFTCDLIEDIRTYRNPPQDVDSNFALRLRIQNTGLVKLREVMGESFTQATLQQYIVFQTVYPELYGKDSDDMGVETWQVVTISLSIVALAFGISTSVPSLGKANDASIMSKIIWFIFGLLAVSSRIYVACMYSMISKPMLLLPLFVALAASIIIWSFVSCCNIRQLAYFPHHSCTMRHNVAIALTWIVTSSFNCFTWSGLAISTINLMLAVGAGFISVVPNDVANTSLILASISWTANFIITNCPCLKQVRDDWFRIDEERNTIYFY